MTLQIFFGSCYRSDFTPSVAEANIRFVFTLSLDQNHVVCGASVVPEIKYPFRERVTCSVQVLTTRWVVIAAVVEPRGDAIETRCRGSVGRDV